MKVWMIIGVIIIFLLVKLRKGRYDFEVEFRKCESPIEEKMMRRLYELGYKPYGQVKCGNYRIDISIYAKGKKIAIECDGQAYHTSPKQVAHDHKKNYYLTKNKWHVLRFRGVDIYKNLPWCIEIIEKRIKS